MRCARQFGGLGPARQKVGDFNALLGGGGEIGNSQKAPGPGTGGFVSSPLGDEFVHCHGISSGQTC